MNQQTKLLLDQINEKLKDCPLVYISREIERSLGLEDLLENYHIACIEDHYIVDQLLENSIDVFCLDKFNGELSVKSSLNLISNAKVQKWISDISKSCNFNTLFFQSNEPLIRKVKMLHGNVLNIKPFISSKFEQKLSQFRFFQENNIPIPESKLVELNDSLYESLVNEFGEIFVIQLDRAHTGGGTFFIRGEEDWTSCMNLIRGNVAKVSKFIKGDSYTINACITKNANFIGGLQYQITGVTELTSGEGTTVGNDWSYANSLDSTLKQGLFEVVRKLSEAMKKEGYRGLFGIDLVLGEGKWYVIEINARQTANLAMQTKLELMTDQVPLMLLNLAELLGIEIDIKPNWEILPLNGSQVFLRAKVESVEIKNDIKSGIYRLQSDDSALDFTNGVEPKENVLFIDEDQDKPLIWQKEGYNVLDINDGGFVLLGQKSGMTKKKHEEILRFQFKNQIVNDGKVAPWIIEAMGALEKVLIN
jgi:hypothetical protein